MNLTKCIGRDAASGAAIEVSFGETIREVVRVDAAPENFLAPGWIDIQVNGYAGVDYNGPATPHEEIARSLEALLATGVTRFYPTIITGTAERMEQSLRNVARAAETLEHGGLIEGLHVEGPFIAPDDGPRGAHPRQCVRPPNVDEYRRWQDATGGRIRLITLSPEYAEAPAFIEAIVADGVVASIGHTQATAEQISAAVSAGATLSTHLGNGAHAVMRRHPNYIWDQLAEDGLMADFIADGVHLGANFLKTALRAKGVARSVLVTDAVVPAACKPGRYYFGEQAVDLTPDHHVVLAGTDKLAGSALSMDRGVSNLIRLAGLSLADAVRLATTNAAIAGRVPGRKQGLAAGDRADLVEFRYDPRTHDIEVLATWVDGARWY
jgi:N-acetylglucosamine-6-phosphate deacetylase